MQDTTDERLGRDLQLRCKTNRCEVCGPKNREKKTRDILSDFGGTRMNAIEVEDGGKEWEALSKRLERSEESYHRIPAPNGKAIVLTSADIGEPVEDRKDFVQKTLKAQPCGPKEKQRATSSGDLKRAGSRVPGHWKRLGISRLPLEKRVQVYDQEGCNPVEVPEYERPASAVAAHDLTLPSPGTPQMERLSERLGFNTEVPGLREWAAEHARLHPDSGV